MESRSQHPPQQGVWTRGQVHYLVLSPTKGVRPTELSLWAKDKVTQAGTPQGGVFSKCV